MKASIAMITYNHERFITQAIESVMMQVTDFDYELVIGEDCSTDGTADICLAFQSRYPDRIRVLTSEANRGMMVNFMRTYAACTGEYIALLDGDDYWITHSKLDDQVKLLDANVHYSMCFTRAAGFDSETQEILYYLPPEDRDLTIGDFLAYNQVATSTVMFRRALQGDLPSWFANLPMGDWPLHILNTQHGPAAYLDTLTTGYRLHSRASYSGLTLVDKLERELKVYEAIETYLSASYMPMIAKAKTLRGGLLARESLRRGDIAKAWFYMGFAVKSTAPQGCLSRIPFYIVVTACRVLVKWLGMLAKRLSQGSTKA